MPGMDVTQLVFLIFILILCIKPLGSYMAYIFSGKKYRFDFVFKYLEKGIYQICKIDPTEEMDWKTYLISFL